MIQKCSQPYTSTKYNEHHSMFPFPLSDFQKYSIEGIVEGNNVLVTAHTGSGKTLPIEFAIRYITGKGKKVIYTSPIKALSNQKYKDFSLKFPDITFGILTGDRKVNPDAQVLIMTTEVLMNALENMKMGTTSTNYLSFDIDIETELGLVAYDEVHYITDKERGHVWEKTLMWLPSHIQLLLLSASIDNPMLFATWLSNKTPDKSFYLVPTDFRVVPLVHYCMNVIQPSEIEYMKKKHKDMYEQFRDSFNKPLIIKDVNSPFYTETYLTAKKIQQYVSENIFVSREFSLKSVINYLFENEMLPAIAFVLSKDRIKKYADSIDITIFELSESSYPSIIEKKCEKILRDGLPNYMEYIHLPEYIELIGYLKKGFAIHHSAMLPILRELVEILMSEGFVKLLICTETFAVGLNMPAKTVIMSDISKFDGSSFRTLYPDEYMQMAGRGGRRGFDTIGHVIHCNSMFKCPLEHEYNYLMNGPPKRLESRFTVSFHLVLKMLQNSNKSMVELSTCADKSLASTEHSNDTVAVVENYHKKKEKYEQTNKLLNVDVTTYYILRRDIATETSQGKRKKMQKEMNNLKKTIPTIDAQANELSKQILEKKEIDRMEKEIEDSSNLFLHETKNCVSFLKNIQFIDDDMGIAHIGMVATMIRELPPLVFAKILLETNYFEDYDEYEILVIFSMFNNIHVKPEYEHFTIHTRKVFARSDTAYKVTEQLCLLSERVKEIDTNMKNALAQHYIIPYIEEPNLVLHCLCKWMEANDSEQASQVLLELSREHGISSGDFVKAIFKLGNVINEMIHIGECDNQLIFLEKLHSMPEKIMKFIAVNQTLYV
jgi:superfamily II RNA helicase